MMTLPSARWGVPGFHSVRMHRAWAGLCGVLLGILLSVDSSLIRADAGNRPAPLPLKFGAFRRGESRPLTSVPTHIDPTGQYVAVVDSGEGATADAPKRMPSCSVWRVQDEAWLGVFPRTACDWPPTRRANQVEDDHSDSQRVVPSPDGKLEALWRNDDATVSVRRVGEKLPRATYPTDCTNPPCAALHGLSWAPDSRRLLLATGGSHELLIWDSQTGKVTSRLKLSAQETLRSNLLAIGPELVAVVTDWDTSQSSEAQAKAPDEFGQGPERTAEKVHVFGLDGRPLRVLPARDLSQNGPGAWSLDANARFLFRWGNGDGGESFFLGLDLRTGKEIFHHNKPAISEWELHGPVTENHWYPGPVPIYETLEFYPREGEKKEYRAWHIHAGKSAANLYAESVELATPPPDPCRPRRVAADGKQLISALPGERYQSCEEHATDPSGRLVGVGKDRLRRVRDRLELVVPDRPGGCAETGQGLHSCLGRLRAERYLAGSDPRRLVVLRGDQLFPLLLRSALVSQFLDGTPLALPAAATVIESPPTLERVPSVDTLPSLKILLRPSGTAAGEGVLRIFVDGTEHGAARAVNSGEVSTVELDLTDKRCSEVAVYLCKASGNICSLPVELRPCSGKQSGSTR